MYAALKATALDLSLDPNIGHAYVVPYKVNKGSRDNPRWETEGQLQIGYRGFYQLSLRTSQFSRINVTEIKQGEISSVDHMTGDYNFEWLSQDKRSDAETIGYLAYFRLHNGFEKMLYMSVEELDVHGCKYSKTFTYGNSLWKKDLVGMSKKTVLKMLLNKYAPLSTNVMANLQEAIIADQGVIGETEIQYPDNDGTDEENMAKADLLSKPIDVTPKNKKTMNDEAFGKSLIRYKGGEINIFQRAESKGYELTESQIEAINSSK